MPDLNELCAAAVDAATGDEAVEAYAEESRQTEASALRGEIEGLTFAESRGVGVRLIAGGRLGYAYAADPTAEEVRDAVRRARENAALAEPDEFNRLPTFTPAEPDPRAVSRGSGGDPYRPEGSRWRWTLNDGRSRSTPAPRRSTPRRSETRSHAWRSRRRPAFRPSTRGPTRGPWSSPWRSRAMRRRRGSRSRSGAASTSWVGRGSRMRPSSEPCACWGRRSRRPRRCRSSWINSRRCRSWACSPVRCLPKPC